MTDRKGMHAMLTPKAHAWWLNMAHSERVTLTGILQAMADREYKLPGYIFDAAGKVDIANRNRRWAKK